MGKKIKINERKPHAFCEGKEPCSMNYCDDNGCQERKRNYVDGNSNSSEEGLNTSNTETNTKEE